MTAGMDAMMTPAEIALVMLTPYNMKTEKSTLPKSDSRKTSFFVSQLIGGSQGEARNQCVMASPPMANRIQASKNTGNASTRGLDSAT